MKSRSTFSNKTGHPYYRARGWEGVGTDLLTAPSNPKLVVMMKFSKI
jgi:hypothetical protein